PDEPSRRPADLAAHRARHHLPLRRQHGGGPCDRASPARHRGDRGAGEARRAIRAGAGDPCGRPVPAEGARGPARVKPEDRFVEKLRALLPRADGVLLGPGDDAALIAWPEESLAATTDLLVEGVDFLPGEDPRRLGRRAVAVNLSDLAAMGAEPAFFLLAIGFPAERGEELPLAIARRAIERGADYGAHLAGGDLSAASQTIISVAAWGRPAPSPLTRSGAKPGDFVFISGHPGDAAAGLKLAQTITAFSHASGDADPRFPELSADHQQRLLAAFQDPVPRVVLGRGLAMEGLATAAIDVSDGLRVDARRLA